VDIDTLPTVLDGFALSFDTRAEPATIASKDAPAGEAGFLNYDAIGQLNLQLSMVEKRQWAFGGAPLTPEREVFSVSLNSIMYSGRTLRFNPFLKNDLSKMISPYKTYMMVLSCPELYGVGTQKTAICLPSLLMSFKFRHPLTYRDNGAALQNIPTVHNGTKTGEVIATPNPVANEQIKADGANGIQSSIERFDLPLMKGLEGGYERDSDTPPIEAIATDASYEIIAVPMWSNMGTQYGIRAADVRNLPYMQTQAYDDLTCDRRIIPLDFPMVIHHVYAVASYAWPYDGINGGYKPTSITLTNEIGVGIGTGLRGDLWAYQQVAYEAWGPANIGTFTIDRVRACEGSTVTQDDWDYDMVTVRLVGPVGTDNGYMNQGQPIFVGKARSITTPRSNVGGGPPLTAGLEQWIECRWAFQDTDGLGYTPAPTAGPYAAGDNTFALGPILVGTGGLTAVTDTAAFTKEAGEPNHGGDAGGKSAWWTWNCMLDGSCTVTTAGSYGVIPADPSNQTLGVYTGAAVNALTPVAGTGATNPGLGLTAHWTFDCVSGTTYHIATDSVGGAPVHTILNWVASAGVADSEYTTYVGRGGNWIFIVASKTLATTKQ
jgi:hypothetical protein